MFREKANILVSNFSEKNTNYPTEGLIECEVLKITENIITVSLEYHYGTESQNGHSIFQVYSSQLLDV